MANIATLLKTEITRLARKEVRTETVRLQKASSAYRAEIAALKRRLAELERLMKKLSGGVARPAMAAGPAEGSSASGDSAKGRFSAKSMRSQRKRLALSAAEMGRLLGSSAQSVYNWEEGKARPQGRHMEAIFALRTLGRRDVQKRLEALGAAAG